jgi:hypothetical protein
MRKVTKKKDIKRKRKRKTQINIKQIKGRGKESYQEVVDKFKIIFGEKVFSKILYYSNPNYIQKFIDLLNIERSKPNMSNMSNSEQITNILHPAVEAFLNFIRNEYFVLKAVIPSIVNTDRVLKPSRIEKILTLAKKDRLIEEFIRDLEVLKLGPNSTINIPRISSSPVVLPSTPLPPPPSEYKFKSPHKSPHKSKSPYKSPHKSKSPYKSPEAIEVTRVSKRTPGSIRVVPIIYPSSGGRHNNTKNKVYNSYKKTRRHKKH